MRRAISRPCRLLILAALVPFFTGCSWLGWDEGTSPRPKSPQGSAQAKSYSQGTTLADKRLERIYKKQEEVLAQLQANPDDFTLAEKERLMQNLLSEYQSFVYENPDFVYGYILYGKLLRQLGDREAANIAFAKANQLDPQIAVVKQQLGNYIAEQGEWETALRYFASAAEIEPDNALYHYQIGELLYHNRNRLLNERGMPVATFDAELLSAFSEAARLDPGNRTFQKRYAETFFDIQNPDWPAALNLWNYLENTAENPLERDIIRMQKARVLLAMGRAQEAESILIVIEQPSLENARLELLQDARS